MHIKSIAAAVAVAQTLVAAAANSQDYWKSFKTGTDPLNITLPKMKQLDSNDPVTECSYYETPAQFKYVESEWPTMWETATSNGMTKTAEFKALYNSIDWKKMPNIPVRKATSDGGLDMTGYDDAKDPDCWWSSSLCTKPKHEGINEDIYTCPEPDTWGLTYDDGPNCSHNAFYDFLEEKKLKASMFYIGSNVVNWPYGAMRGIKNGHHIADHTWSHQLMTTLTNEEVLAELYYTQKAIKLITGVTPLHWRAAFGDVDDRVRWIATQLGLTSILWSEDTDDWKYGESPSAAAEVEKNYADFINMGNNGTFKQHGNIVLSHEINNATMSIAIDHIPKIQKAYKHVVDVATCMNITNPYQEKTVTFPTFAEYLSGKTSGGSSSSSGAASGSSAASSASGNSASSSNGGAAASSSGASAKSAQQSTDATSAGFKTLPTNAMGAAVALALLAALV